MATGGYVMVDLKNTLLRINPETGDPVPINDSEIFNAVKEVHKNCKPVMFFNYRIQPNPIDPECIGTPSFLSVCHHEDDDVFYFFVELVGNVPITKGDN